MRNIVCANFIKENINNEKLVIVDCRFSLMDKEYGKRCFEEEHIKGAQRIDLETDLSSEVKEHGGRHPIPTIEELKNSFENIGISNDSIVVAYDEGDLAGPSRLWWILRYLGHKEVYVLDGGIGAYKEIGGETTSEVIKPIKGSFNPKVQDSMRVDMHYVRDKINNSEVAIVDSREKARYIGEFEPVDKKAGHIPSALNYFWMDILKKEDGKINLKAVEELKTHFKELEKYKEIIVYCGSGVTACPNSLALYEIGINNKVYLGSFSDWISYDENEIEKEI